MKKVIRAVPFIFVITLNVFAQVLHYEIESIKFIAIITGTLLLVNMFIAITMKVKDYFLYGISVVGITGITFLLIGGPIGELYIKHIITGLYLGLFIVAFIPPLFKIKPFTIAFSEGDYSKAITKGIQFLKINLILNYLWALLFLIAMILTNISYSSNVILQTVLAMVIPILLQVIIGIPMTIKLPRILMDVVKGEQLHFESIKELFESMPFGLNKKRAEGLDVIVQFILTGDEPTIGHLTIKNQRCTYTEGQHKEATTTIKCDSKLWLAISNNEVSGDAALINKEYEVEGDASILLGFAKLFSTEVDAEVKVKVKSKTTEVSYRKFAPNKIKNVVVFDGGPRNEKMSKTTLATKKFCEGLEAEGAVVEYIQLKDKKIKNCTGCYTCWTKTPGQCIYKDDMPELLEKYRSADLVVFASPLYIFNVTGILKTFMDRLLPITKPYMLISDDGHILHPDRYPERGEQGFVVFGAAGFPDLDNNFDGMRSMFKMWNSHSENMHMMGEFYITAAEMLAQPVYRFRKEKILETCYKAGIQIVKEGYVNLEDMVSVSDPGVSLSTFQSQSDLFWESMDGKKAYLSESPKL